MKKTIEICVMTRDDIINEMMQISERVSAMSKSNLDEFGNSCLQHDQQLLADYKKLLDAYSWKNIFYLYNGKSVEIYYNVSYPAVNSAKQDKA